jgi:hypothetical protein
MDRLEKERLWEGFESERKGKSIMREGGEEYVERIERVELRDIVRKRVGGGEGDRLGERGSEEDYVIKNRKFE